MYYLAAILLVFIGTAHSYLGERYILTRLFHNDNLPQLFGGTEFTKNTLRFAWHLTTVAWFGFALLVVYLSINSINIHVINKIISGTFFLHFIVAFVGSKGKHFSWFIFLIISALTFFSSNT